MFGAFRCRRHIVTYYTNRQAGSASTSLPPDLGGKRLIEFAVNFGLLGDGFCEFNFGFRTLAARHTAGPQLGPKFVDTLF
jgi:hypothetical protein